LRNSQLAGGEKPEFGLLTDEAEKALIRRVVEFPRVVEAAAQAHEPHRISFYLYEIASDFHYLWKKGKELPQLRFILEGQDKVTLTRLAFLMAIRYCLANGLRLLGVTPVDEM
jgi:arginyl-tRNA synthetase